MAGSASFKLNLNLKSTIVGPENKKMGKSLQALSVVHCKTDLSAVLALLVLEQYY